MKIEDILDSLDAAVLYLDCSHRIQWMNRRAALLFGPGVGRRRACYRVAQHGTEFCHICPTGRAIELAAPTHYEFSFEAEGAPKDLEVIAIPVLDNESRPGSVLEIIMDVTGKGLIKIKHEELMEKVEKMAAIGQLAAGIAHELNTPLGTISILSAEIERAIKEPESVTGEIVREYLSDMRGEIERCKGIINDLLGFSKSGFVRKEPVDMNSLVLKTIELLRKGKYGEAIEIRPSLDLSLPQVETDPDRFRQVLFNILKNALDALEGSGRGRIDISTSAANGFVNVTVEDNGPGIPRELMKRVFEPFFTTKPVGKGTGLGLSVSYGIMRDLKGEIRIESTPGQTRVELLLPVRERGGDGAHTRP